MNKTRTSKFGAISKSQKAQNIFFGTKLVIFEKKISFKKSRIVPKNVEGGTLWVLLTYIQLQNMKKPKGGPFRHVRFCRFSWKSGKMKGGPFGLSVPRPDLASGAQVDSGLFLKSGPISVRIVV